MSRSSFYYWFFISNTRFLRCFRDTINIATQCNERFAISPFGKPCSWYARDPSFNSKTILFKNFCEVCRCFCFLETKFRKTKDNIHHFLCCFILLIQCCHYFFFPCISFGRDSVLLFLCNGGK